jgi:O-antigen/teichoic acid export membrane protein
MFRNLAYATMTAASAVLLLLLFVFAGRTLGEVEFGKFSFALALGMIFETLMDFGLHQVTIRAVARDKARATELLHHTLGIKLLWMVGAFSALVVTATLLRPEWDVRVACYLLGGSLVLRSYMLTIRGVLQGLERFGWDSIVVAVDRAVLLVVGAAALWAGTGLRGLVIAFVVARAISLTLTAWLTQAELGGIGVRFDREIWRELQSTAVPFGFFLIVINLYSYVDSIMLGKMRGDAETGLYTAAYKTYEGLTYAASVIASVLTPRLAGLFVTDRRKHRRLAILGVTGSAGLALAVGIVAYVVAEPLLVLIYGVEFASAAEPFRILCLGLTFVFAIWVLHAVAMSINKEQLLLKTALIGLTVNVGLNLYVIPRIGANGAALATVIGELVSMVVLLIGVGSLFLGREKAEPVDPRGGRQDVL